MNLIIETIKKEIDNNQFTVFSINDFLDCGNYEVCKKTLQRLEKANYISRIIDGIYMKTSYSKILGTKNMPKIDDVVICLARKYHWSILPTGELCLNLLNLSNQVPGHYIYISDGPYRNYVINGIYVTFKHTTSREIKGMSYKTGLVVQAFKSLGKDNITNDVLNKVREQLNDNEKEKLFLESKEVSSWVRNAIMEVCR